MSTPQPPFKGLPIQINVLAEFVKKWALDHNTTYVKALKSKKMKKDFVAYRATLPLSKPIQRVQQFPPSSFVKADISPDQPVIPSDVADVAPSLTLELPTEEEVETTESPLPSSIASLSPLPETPISKRKAPSAPLYWKAYWSDRLGQYFWYNEETEQSVLSPDEIPEDSDYEIPEDSLVGVSSVEGGKLSAPEIKSFVSASYIDHPDPTIDDWLLDTKLSNETAKVYYNPKEKRAVVVHRGTQGLSDWGNNLAYVLGGYEMTDRYKMGKDTQNKAEKKYGAKNISTLGHSQGAILARKLGANTKEVITVNPAYKFEKPLPNEFVIRSSSDVVSGAYAPVAAARSVLMPKKSQNRDITIPTENRFDVLGEHSSDILDRLPKDQMIGAGNVCTNCARSQRVYADNGTQPPTPVSSVRIPATPEPEPEPEPDLDIEDYNSSIASDTSLEIEAEEVVDSLIKKLTEPYPSKEMLDRLLLLKNSPHYADILNDAIQFRSHLINKEMSNDEINEGLSILEDVYEYLTTGQRLFGTGLKKKARPSKIQTILFSKDKWTKRKATAWLKKHNYSNKGVDDKPDTLRYRQLNPTYVERIGYTQYITKPLGDSGVSLVIVYK